MNNELRLATKDLAVFLQNHLTDLSDEWWDEHVVSRLSFQQQRFVEERKISNLRELDFAALLRVLDQNWFDLNEQLSLPREARNWIKELQTVRNKWAHMGAEKTPASEIYRDADTLGRLLNLINADKKSISAVRTLQDRALASMTERANTSDAEDIESLPKTKLTPKEQPNLFNLGEVVSLRSDKTVKLPVIEVITSGPEVRYGVFQDGVKSKYYESQLQVAAEESRDVAVDARPLQVEL